MHCHRQRKGVSWISPQRTPRGKDWENISRYRPWIAQIPTRYDGRANFTDRECKKWSKGTSRSRWTKSRDTLPPSERAYHWQNQGYYDIFAWVSYWNGADTSDSRTFIEPQMSDFMRWYLWRQKNKCLFLYTPSYFSTNASCKNVIVDPPKNKEEALYWSPLSKGLWVNGGDYLRNSSRISERVASIFSKFDL